MRLYDKDIRKILMKEFLNIPQFISDQSTVIINELDVCAGSAIMDIVVVNGEIHGFEIKSERDNLKRLPQQISYYNRVFDRVTLVVSSDHLDKAQEMIPEWWGIYCINKCSDDEYNLIIIKESDLNKEDIDTFNLSQILWKNELIELLNSQGISKGLKSKTRRQLSKIISENIHIEIVKEFVKNRLKSRTDWKAISLQQLYDEIQH